MAQSIADLAITLSANVAGFTSDMGRAAREAKKQAYRMEKSFDGAKRALRNLLTFAAGAAILRTIAKNTIDAANEQAKLAAVLRATGNAAGLSVKELNDMADALQRATTFDAGSITDMQSVLLTFKAIGRDIFPAATEAVLDLSSVMGGDLIGAAKQLGKALEDPVKGINAMVRSGVSFSEEQQAVIKALVETNRKAEAQKIILEAVEGQVGGTARALRDTFGGALKSLGHAFNDLLEGGAGSGGISGAVSAIEDLTDILQSAETKRGFAYFIERLAVMSVGAVGVATSIAQATQAVSDMFSTNMDKSDTGLQDRFIALTEERRRLKAGKGSSASVFGPVPGRTRTLDQVNAEIAEIQREMTARIIAENARRVMPFNQALPNNALGAAPAVDTSGLDLRTSKQKADAAKAAREAEKLQREAMRQAEQAAKDFASASEGLVGILDQQAATMGGPMVESGMRYRDTMTELLRIEEDLARLGKLDEEQIGKLAAARDNATLAYTKQIGEMQGLAKTLEDEVLGGMQLEIDMLGMEETARWAHIEALRIEQELRRNGIAMTPEELAAIRSRIEAKAEEFKATQELVSEMDSFRSAFADNVADVLTGSKSVKDAFSDMVDAITQQIARMLAQRWTEQLFGPQGTDQTGSIGGWIMKLFSFGGGKAAGGPVSAGIPYLVGEQGPELIIPKSAGTVIPAQQTRQMMGGVNVTQNINVTGSVDRRTRLQMAGDASRMQRLATRNA